MELNFSQFHFLRPFWLLALMPYALLVLLTLRNKLKQGSWQQVCDAALLPYILDERTIQKNHWMLTSSALAAFLVIIALAGPSWEHLPAPVFRNSSALVIVLDLSASMDATDIKPSRLIRARYKIADILKRRKDGQTALLVYAGDAFVVTPLTDDTDTINNLLPTLTTQLMPAPGSNTKAALQKAVALFKQAGLQSGQILLVTDGVDAKANHDAIASLGHYQLSILAAGTEEGAPIKLPEGGFMKDNNGNIVIPKINSAELQRLARASGGQFARISPDDRDIEGLFRHINSVVSANHAEDPKLQLQQWLERGPWLLLLALPLAAFSFRRGLLNVLLLSFVCLPQNSYALQWRDLWQNPDQQAQQAFQQAQYEQAARQFTDPAWKAAAQYKSGHYDKALQALQDVKNAEGYYNKGNALVKSGHLQEALKAYQQALQLNPENEDASYNKKLVEQALKKQKQQPQQNNSKQQKNAANEKQPASSGQQKQGEQSSAEQQKSKSKKQETAKDQQPSSGGSKSADNSTDEKTQQGKAPVQTGQQQTNNAEKQSDKQQTEQAGLPDDSAANELQQADEQWLKRIPDDPGGLLRRKFKYQYSRRKRHPVDSGLW